MNAGNSKKPPEPDPKVPSARLRTKLAALVVSSLISLALGEIGLRLFMAKEFPIFQNEKNLLYRYDATLGWFPIPNTTNRVSDLRTILAIHNSNGFRDIEHIAEGNKPRLLFLGDSYVWGYDAEASERFTNKLQARHPEWEVFNCGISGYGTDQEFLLLQRIYEKFKPRLVFLIFCSENDDVDNRWNFRHESYFKPYYTTNEHGLELHNVPVPRSERAFFLGHPLIYRSYLLRLVVRVYCEMTTPPRKHLPSPTFTIIHEMQKYLTARGTVMTVGFTKKYPRLEPLLDGIGIRHLDFSSCEQYPSLHWTTKGHDCVCEAIDQFLKNNNYMMGASGKNEPRE